MAFLNSAGLLESIESCSARSRLRPCGEASDRSAIIACRATARSGVANVLNLHSAFGSIADMAGIAAGSTRSRMTQNRPRLHRNRATEGHVLPGAKCYGPVVFD